MNFRIREFCEDNRLTLKKADRVAICSFTGDVYRFVDLCDYRGLDRIRGMYIDQLIRLDRLYDPRDEILSYIHYNINRTRQMRKIDVNTRIPTHRNSKVL